MFENRFSAVFCDAAGGGPASSQRSEVNEIERGAIAKGCEPFARSLCGDWSVHRLRAGQREDCIVKIGLAGAIARGAGVSELAGVKITDQRGGISEQTGGQARDLEQLQPEAHLAATTISIFSM